MPERYRPDPILEAAVSIASQGSDTPSAKLPIASLRDWLQTDPPTTLSVAPRDESSVRIGYEVPSILGTVTVGKAEKYNGTYPNATLPLGVLQYMDASPGDRLEVERIDGRTLEVRCMEDQS